MDFSSLASNELLPVFNDQLKEFLEQLQIISNDLTEKQLLTKRSKANIEFYKNMVEKGLAINQEIVIETFGSFILTEQDFINHIINKDDAFFMNHDYSGTTDDTNIQELIMIVKDVWQYISNENKDIIFEYLQILCQLTVAYANKKYT